MMTMIAIQFSSKAVTALLGLQRSVSLSASKEIPLHAIADNPPTKIHHPSILQIPPRIRGMCSLVIWSAIGTRGTMGSSSMPGCNCNVGTSELAFQCRGSRLWTNFILLMTRSHVRSVHAGLDVVAWAGPDAGTSASFTNSRNMRRKLSISEICWSCWTIREMR